MTAHRLAVAALRQRRTPADGGQREIAATVEVVHMFAYPGDTPLRRHPGELPLEQPVRSRRVPRQRYLPNRSADPRQEPGTGQEGRQPAVQAVRLLRHSDLITEARGGCWLDRA